MKKPHIITCEATYWSAMDSMKDRHLLENKDSKYYFCKLSI